jgi:HAAS domain-containing protein
MMLSQAAESRVRGYLFVLERSLRAFLPSDFTADAVREVESHIRERVLAVDPMPNERDALERILAELGSPTQVARAYSDELTVEEAVTTGRIIAVARSLLRVASTGIVAFVAALLLFTGYSVGVGFAIVAVLKPIFPNNTGLWLRNDVPASFGTMFPAPADAVLVGGYWVIPISLFVSLFVLLVTHRTARSWLRRWRGRFHRVELPAGR